MQYGSTDTRAERAQSKRHRAITIVKVWMNDRPYVDKQFKAALEELIPELKPGHEFKHRE